MKLEELTDYIFHAHFPEQHQLISTFVRFYGKEYSPFKERNFTAQEVVDWYEATYGKTFYNHWAGFQVTSKELEPFLKGDLNPLTEQEKVLFSAIPARRKEYDVIMTYGENNKGVLKHELSHVLSKRDREYQAQVLQTFGRFQESEFDWKSLQKELLAAGYRKEEVPIELNAIIIELNIINLLKH